jgi:hypothetical protein
MEVSGFLICFGVFDTWIIYGWLRWYGLRKVLLCYSSWLL